MQKVAINVICIYLVLVTICGLKSCQGSVGRSGFPLIFPFLTSGWYYKPGPTESVFLGLILVKVLALRLASVTGILPIPYHLNDLFVRSLGKRSIRPIGYESYKNLTNYNSNEVKPFMISDDELKIVERILLGLLRIDSEHCFLKSLCLMSQDTKNQTSDYSEILDVFKLRTHYPLTTTKHLSWLWSTYENAINVRSSEDCSSKYNTCLLQNDELQIESLLSGLF